MFAMKKARMRPPPPILTHPKQDNDVKVEVLRQQLPLEVLECAKQQEARKGGW